MANVFEMVFRAVDKATGPIRKIRKATKGLETGAKNFAARIAPGFKQVGKGVGRVARSGLVAAGVLTSVYGSAALAAGGMTDVASSFERYETILVSSTGSQKKARTAMGWVTNFAATTPYQLDQVTEAFVGLKNYGINPVDGTLKTLGDTSAAMGKPLMQSIEAIADAVTGENERLKEFGVTASKTGDQITYAYTNSLGKAMTATVKAGDRAAIQTRLMEIFSEKFGGSMERLSSTWDGMMSNLGDMWMKFQLMIMNAGLFDWMKGKLKLLLDTINKMEADGSLQEWAKTISERIQAGLKGIWEFGVRVYTVMQSVKTALSTVASWVGGMENLAYILAGLAFAPTLISTAIGLVQIANGLRLIGLALFANPIGIAIVAIAAAIAGAAYLIYSYWDDIEPYFAALWEGVKSSFTAAWDFIKAAFEWHPVSLIYENWGGISDAFSSVIEAARSALASPWETIKALFAWNPVALIRSNWDGISNIMTRGMEIASSAISETWGTIKNLFDWKPSTLLQGNWSDIEASISSGLESGLARLRNLWQEVKALFDWSPVEVIREKFGKIGDVISNSLASAGTKISAAWDRIKPDFSDWELPSLWGDDKKQAKLDVSDPKAIERAARLTKEIEASQKAIQGEAANVLAAVQNMVNRANAILAAQDWTHHGRRMMDTLAAGMKARAQVVVDQIRATMQQVRDHLPSSPAKTGPLSDIDRLKFGETIARSIRPAPMVRAMRSAAAATRAAANDNLAAGLNAGFGTAPSGTRTRDTISRQASGPAMRDSANTRSGGDRSGKGRGDIHINIPSVTLGGENMSEKAFEDLLERSARKVRKVIDNEDERIRRKTY
jgi:hypothetical protein